MGPRLTKIVTGGQTGVDRGALDAAIDAKFPCGGWCPPGRLAEDGRIPDRYPVTEMQDGGYVERTVRNVVESDATLVLTFGPPRGGTLGTVEACERYARPCLVIDLEDVDQATAVAQAVKFVEGSGAAVLNVAGPRASQFENARDDGFSVVARVLRALSP